MTNTNWPLMDYTKANTHQMAIEHKYQIDFVLTHNANALNRPSKDTVYCDKLRALYKYPTCRDLRMTLSKVAEWLPDSEPLLLLSNLVSRPNIPVG